MTDEEKKAKELTEQKAEIVAALTAAIEKENKGSVPGLAELVAKEIDTRFAQMKGLPDILGRDLHITIEGKGAPKKDPYFFTKLGLDMLDIRAGRKPTHGTDFDALASAHKSHLELAGEAGVTSTTAGAFVPPEHSTDLIDLTFKEAPLLSRCRRREMATDTMTITTLIGGVVVSWTPEVTDANTITTQAQGKKPNTNFTPSLLTMNKKTAHVFVFVSRKMLRIGNPDIENTIRTLAPLAIDAECSRAILSGAGSATDPITGLDNLITTNQPTWDAANPRGSVLKFLMAPGLQLGRIAASNLVVMGAHAMQYLHSLLDKNDRPLDLLDMSNGLKGSKMLLGIEAIDDYNIPATYGAAPNNNKSRMYAGNFGYHMNVAVDPAMFALVDPYTMAGENMVRYLFEINFAAAPSHEKCFSQMNVPVLQ